MSCLSNSNSSQACIKRTPTSSFSMIFLNCEKDQNLAEPVPSGRKRADKRGIPASGRGCQASGERTAGPLYGNDCRYRNPYQRASIFHRRTGKKGTDRNHQQRKVQKDFSAGSSEKEAAGLFQKEGNPGRLYFRYTKWEAERPE